MCKSDRYSNNLLTSTQEDHKNLVECKLQRRATSPLVPSPSPRLSLFPNTNIGRSASPITRPLHRSRTAPEKSPLRQIFTRNEEEIAKGRELFLQRAATASHLKLGVSQSTKPQQPSASNHSVVLDIEAFAVGGASTTPAQSQNVHSDRTEQNHDNHPTTHADSYHQAKINALTALRSHPASSSVSPLDVPSPLQRISSLRSPLPSTHRPRAKRTASETRNNSHDTVLQTSFVSVARSVSVSRASSPRVLVGQGVDVDVGERFVERQVLTPTMVEMRNRRSVRVQLEDV
jgi:hypothetical protein